MVLDSFPLGFIAVMGGTVVGTVVVRAVVFARARFVRGAALADFDDGGGGFAAAAGFVADD